jgi:hypothetical protein
VLLKQHLQNVGLLALFQIFAFQISSPIFLFRSLRRIGYLLSPLFLGSGRFVYFKITRLYIKDMISLRRECDPFGMDQSIDLTTHRVLRTRPLRRRA